MQKLSGKKAGSKSRMRSARRYSTKILVIFMLLFGAVGGYVLYRSYAATDPRLANVFTATSPYFQHPAPYSDFTTEGSTTVLYNSVNTNYPQLLWLGPNATFTYYTNGTQTITACFRVRDMGQATYGPNAAANLTFSITNNGGAEILKSQTVTLSSEFSGTSAYGYYPYCITTGVIPNGKQFTNLQYRIVVNGGAIRVQSVDLHGIDFTYTPPPSNNPSAPSPTPGTSTPKPTTSPSTTTKPKVTVQGSGTVPVTGSIQVDTAPPSKPGDFKAESDPGDPGINLSWSASSDDVAVAGYKLERSSSDGQTWDTLTSSVKDTGYFDYETQFDTKYQYRVTAIDTTGNKSESAVVEVIASSFQPNAGPDKSLKLHSDDNTVGVEIPEGALKDQAVCKVQLDSQIGTGPSIKGLTQIGGPYNVICKGNDNNLIDNFEKPLNVSVSTKEYKKYKSRSYYAKNTSKTDWIKVAKFTHNKKDNTDNFTLQNENSFVVMGKLSHTPLWIKLLIGLAILGALIYGLSILAKRITKGRLERQYDDYYRKANGL